MECRRLWRYLNDQVVFSQVVSKRSTSDLGQHTALSTPNEVIKSPSLVLRIADRHAPLDAELAGEALLEALGTGLAAQRTGSRGGLVNVAEAVPSSPPAKMPPRASDLFLEGLIARMSESYR
jgi:hypothetical protein